MTIKKKNVISGWFHKIPLNIGTFIFGALFVYMLITVILYLTADHIQSYQVTAGPLSSNKTYTALAIREESVLPAILPTMREKTARSANQKRFIRWVTVRLRRQSMT